MYNDGGSSGSNAGIVEAELVGAQTNHQKQHQPIDTNGELDRKITLATECLTTAKASELILKIEPGYQKKTHLQFVTT